MDSGQTLNVGEAKAGNELLGDAAWQELRRLYPASPFLNQVEIYALAAPVLIAVSKALPEFFTPEQLRFEIDLARMTVAGLFLRRAIIGSVPPDYPFHPPCEPPREESGKTQDLGPACNLVTPPRSPEALKSVNSRNVNETYSNFTGLLLRQQRSDDTDFESARAQRRDEGDVLDRRSEAYAGWLVLNPQFRKELSDLRSKHEANIALGGGFPRRERDAHWGDASEPLISCRIACQSFYRRWCLDRMLTWDMPVPLEAQTDDVLGEPRLAYDEGVTLTLPWPMLKGGRFDVQKVVERIRYENAPSHLREWLRPSANRKDHDGEIRYQRLFWLYRIYELVLFRRYPVQCRGNLSQLDWVIARVMGRDEELVRKLRQRIMREREINL